MKTIIAKPYAEAQMQRRALIERGVPPWRVTACSTANLNDLDAEYQQLTLVPDVGRPALAVVEGGRPDPVRRMMDDGCSPDEIASVLTYARGVFVESEFDGSDAA